MLDWIRVLTSMIAVILILIPMSQGGTFMPWNSPVIISMSTSGASLFLAFIIFEWGLVDLPILPIRLFRYNKSTNILLATHLLIGWVFWGNLFYLPLYFQNVRGYSPTAAGSLILPMVIAHGVTSGLSGLLMSLTGHYKPVISIGAGLWTTGAMLKSSYGKTTSSPLFCLTGILEGIGVSQFQSQWAFDIMIMSSNISAVSGAILNNVIQAGLEGQFSSEVISQLTSSAFALSNLKLSPAEEDLILMVYARGLRFVFISFGVLTMIMFMASICLHDYGLVRKNQSQGSDNDDDDDDDEQ
ncbi:major facilitator superfamily domain-containing protein [Penicillium angulare]|uniref:major facilitator superfamily domain-containing protein n=1 Tax=Penicillium angulare TaxID=116970 RepID=UPI0025425817|nr:major facilitator superfamily domain-containing protein [Penicillium angulare]KAJ5280193.1 major facilitator superfamily domain-containing protein [Penicillium angulare]